MPLYFYNNETPTTINEAIDSVARESFFGKHIALQQASTTVNAGGGIEVASDDTINISGGFGFWIDHNNYDESSINPTFKKITWPSQEVLVPNISGSQEFSFVYIDAVDSTVGFKQTEPSPEDYRNKLLLGKVIHRNGGIDFVVPLKPRGSDVFNQFSDLAHAIGTINIAGNVWSPSDPENNLTVKKTQGSSFRLNSQSDNKDNPHTTIDPSFDSNLGETFSYVYRDGNGGVTYQNGITEVTPLYFDNGTGVLETLASSKSYTVQRIYSFPKPSIGGGGKNYIFYGQKVYHTIEDAIDGIETEEFELPAENFYDASLRGWLIMRRSITDFSDERFYKFVTAGKFGENAGGSSLSAEASSLFRDDFFKIENDGDPSSFLKFSLQNLLDTGEVINIQANANQVGSIDLTLPSISGQLALIDDIEDTKDVLQDQIDDINTVINEITISGGGTPIKTFETPGTLGSAGGSTTAIRTTDA